MMQSPEMGMPQPQAPSSPQPPPVAPMGTAQTDEALLKPKMASIMKKKKMKKITSIQDLKDAAKNFPKMKGY